MVVKETPRARAVAGRARRDAERHARGGGGRARARRGGSTIRPAVERLRVRLDGVDLSSGADVQGAGQTVTGDVVEVRDAGDAAAGAADAEAARLPAPGALHRERRARDRGRGAEGGRRGDGHRARGGAAGALRERPPREEADGQPALRAARSCARGWATATSTPRSTWPWRARWACPSRIAVGLVYLRGAFYYHAWPEVYVAEPDGRGLWLPVDPTLNQFPADATHIRLARGGLDKQAAILPAHRPREACRSSTSRRGAGTTPVLVGRPAQDTRPIELALPATRRAGLLVAARALTPMIQVEDLVKRTARSRPWTA